MVILTRCVQAFLRNTYIWLTEGGGGALLAIAKKRQSTLLNRRHCKGWQTLSCPLKRKPLLVRLTLGLESNYEAKSTKSEYEKYTAKTASQKKISLTQRYCSLNPKLGGLPKQYQNVRGYNVELLEKP
jgi:hypothetical protein